MNSKLCKSLRKQARDESPIGTPLRRLISDRTGKGAVCLNYAAVNGPGTVRGVYRQMKKAAA